MHTGQRLWTRHLSLGDDGPPCQHSADRATRQQVGLQLGSQRGSAPARLVEVISNMPFEDFLKQRRFKPLGMEDTLLWLSAEQYKRLAAVHWMKDGSVVPWGDIHGHPGDYEGGASHALVEPWASINKEAGDHKRIRGSFGLIGTAADYLRFAQMMENGGELNGVRVLSPQVVRYVTRDHL